MNRHNSPDKVAAPALQSTRLLDQVRERSRYLHYSLQTEKAYLHWVRFFIRWHGRCDKMRHPRDMGKAEVEAFLTMLADELTSMVRGPRVRKPQVSEVVALIVTASNSES
jgi:uncharacterized protein YfbU (UPF0304 family)